jgi:hypothetical protein
MEPPLNPEPDPTPVAATPALRSTDPTTTHLDALLDAPAAQAPDELPTDAGKLAAASGPGAADVQQLVADLLG